jgi:Tol biopolymer transport system component
MKVVPFTSLQGPEYMPSFSPDGNQIAFSWIGEGPAIYVKQIGGEKPSRRTSPDTGSWDFGPVWSPDGQRIAFLRCTETEYAIFTVGSLGGGERRLLISPNPGWDMFPTLAWSPDGRSIAFPNKDSKEEPYKICFVSPDTFERQTLTSPSAENVGDFAPAFSPNGQSVAFFRMSSTFSAAIYTMPITGGEPTRLTFDNAS